MTLYREIADGFTLWQGEDIDDIRHPRDIELRWTAEELATVGLYEPAPAEPVPDGKQVASTSVQRVAGVVRFVDVLEDIPPPPPPGSAEIAAEVERRIALPLLVGGLSGGAMLINMDPASQRNLQGLASVGLYLSSAMPGHVTVFRDFDNASHDLLPGDLVNMGMQVAARIQAVYAASWALKAMDPIPDDYTDDGYWP